MNKMNTMDFVKGIGIGIVTGAAMGMAVSQKNKNVRAMTGKAMRAAGGIVDNISDAMGM